MTSHGALAGTRNSSMGPPRWIDPGILQGTSHQGRLSLQIIEHFIYKKSVYTYGCAKS